MALKLTEHIRNTIPFTSKKGWNSSIWNFFSEKNQFGLYFAGNQYFHVGHALRHCDVICLLIFMILISMERRDPTYPILWYQTTIGPLHRHLRSNVHPSVAILLEDRQTTGHCTKQWGNIRLVFLVICYDFLGIDLGTYSIFSKKIWILMKRLMLEMIFLSFTWSSIEIECKIVLWRICLSSNTIGWLQVMLSSLTYWPAVNPPYTLSVSISKSQGVVTTPLRKTCYKKTLRETRVNVKKLHIFTFSSADLKTNLLIQAEFIFSVSQLHFDGKRLF